MEYRYDPILCMNVPVEKTNAKDAKTVDENYVVSGMKSQLEQMLKRYKDPKNKNKLVSQYIGIVNNHRANGRVTEEEFNEFVKYAKRLISSSAKNIDKAIKACDVNANPDDSSQEWKISSLCSEL